MMAEMTCIVCPVGCRMEVTITDQTVKVSGNDCRRGELYAKDEAVAPKRVLTSVVKVVNQQRLLPVKTVLPIPKAKIFLAMQEIQAIVVTPPVNIGQTIVSDIAGTGVALIATKNC